ncbi:MAG: formate--tetrahydrofolate ligase [Chloroflexota bacterium]|nr:formate--tetrahydrofolate ligase [Chloroflexota bacterium]
MPVKQVEPVPSDIEVAQAAELFPIVEVAKSVGLSEDDIDLHGKWKAKVHLDVLEKFKDRPNGKYVDVTAITPTPLGEGKTVTTIGVSQGLHYIGKKVFTCIRQPSQGPTFGIKGGAAGGGYAQIVPMEDFNLHLTGDIHAVGAAHNLLAAAINNRMAKEARWSTSFLAKALCPDDEYTPSMRRRLEKLGIESEKPSDLSDEDKERMFRLNIDPDAVQWRRVVDVSDAALRNIVVGLGGTGNGVVRETGYDITVASEIMAALAMCSGLEDLRERMGRIIIGTSKKGGNRSVGKVEPITAEDLNVAGAMTVLLKDALMPNMMQTLPGSPAFVHCGPFANIAQGNSSIIADKIALKLVGPDGYTVTESGFGADCGMEKFMNLKSRYSGLIPNCVVLVCTVRALKMHGGGPKVVAGKPLDRAYTEENLELLEKGLPNLLQHVENAVKFGVPVVVAINRFKYDTDAEIELIRKRAKETGAEDAVMHNVWAKGGEGGADLARAVVAACEKPNNFHFLYDDDMSIKEKIETIAREIYRADGVDYTDEAEAKIKLFTNMGLAHLPLCMAKTHLSFSHDPALKGTPRGWRLPITDVRASVGAGFIFPLCGTMKTMPGLPTRPVFTDIDIDVETGKVLGLS